MDQLRVADLLLRHQHRDGSWGRLEPRPAHHDPAQHDPERAWRDGVLFACATCDERVQVAIGRDAPVDHER